MLPPFENDVVGPELEVRLMEYSHRILIGVTGAIGKMGPQSQLITNKVAFQVGQELANELRDRGMLGGDDSIETVWNVINRELGIDTDPQTTKTTEDGRAVFTAEIRSCNICPKKVGKYAIPGTACPVGSILTGAAELLGLTHVRTTPDLEPGDVCRVAITLDQPTKEIS
jgi:hypothetical protein